METHLTFPDINYLFGALILVISELQLCPVNHKSCRRSWKLVIMTEGDYSTYATHIFLGKSLLQRPKTILIIFLY